MPCQGKFSVNGFIVESIETLDVGTVVTHVLRGVGRVLEFKEKTKRKAFDVGEVAQVLDEICAYG